MNGGWVLGTGTRGTRSPFTCTYAGYAAGSPRRPGADARGARDVQPRTKADGSTQLMHEISDSEKLVTQVIRSSNYLAIREPGNGH